MSGGECYVYDPRGEVLARVNRQLVEARRPDGFQLAGIRQLVQEHAQLTGSTRATRMLEGWEETAESFWRIAPKTELERVASSESAGAKAD
jgi:glutamate synthase domain-containing protein 3